jgi:methyl-accepting chemotaxis protein
MWLLQKHNLLNLPSRSPFRSVLVERDFQLRWTRGAVIGLALGLALVAGPLAAVLAHNYQLFERIAFNENPGLVNDLVREKGFFITYAAASSLFVLAFAWVFIYRASTRIAAPLKVLKNHLKLLSRGHWQQMSIHTRDNDEFRDLIESYNYFYASFQAQVRGELKALEQLRPSEEDRTRFDIWKKLVEKKTSQLQHRQLSVDVPATEPRSRDQRHVS